MPRPYEDDLRNLSRDDIAGTLAARQSPFGYGLEQAGRAMAPAQGAFGGALTNTLPGTAVPAIGGAGGSLLPMPQAQQAQPASSVLMQAVQRMRPMRRL